MRKFFKTLGSFTFDVFAAGAFIIDRLIIRPFLFLCDVLASVFGIETATRRRVLQIVVGIVLTAIVPVSLIAVAGLVFLLTVGYHATVQNYGTVAATN